MWQIVLSSGAGPNYLDCHMAYIDFYLTKCASLFSVFQAVDLYLLVARNWENHAHHPSAQATRLQILKDLITILAQSGHVEQSLLLVLLAGKASDTISQRLRSDLRDRLRTGIPEITEEHSWVFEEFLILLDLESEDTLLEFEGCNLECIKAMSFCLSYDEVAAIWACFLKALGLCIPSPMAKLWRTEIRGRERKIKRVPESFGLYTTPIPLSLIACILEFIPLTKPDLDHYRIALAQIHAHLGRPQDGEAYLQEILAKEPANWAVWTSYANLLRFQERDKDAEKVCSKLLKSELVVNLSWKATICGDYCELLWQRECHDAIVNEVSKCFLGSVVSMPVSAASLIKIKKVSRPWTLLLTVGRVLLRVLQDQNYCQPFWRAL